MSAHAFWFMKDTSDSELVMGMFRVFEIDDQAWNLDSERKKSYLWNRFMLQIAMEHFLEHTVKIWTQDSRFWTRNFTYETRGLKMTNDNMVMRRREGGGARGQHAEDKMTCRHEEIRKRGNQEMRKSVYILEHKTCDILAAERLRLMRFDNRLIIDSFQKAICILKW